MQNCIIQIGKVTTFWPLHLWMENNTGPKNKVQMLFGTTKNSEIGKLEIKNIVGLASVHYIPHLMDQDQKQLQHGNIGMMIEGGGQHLICLNH